MPLQINDNIQSNSPKPLNNKTGKFVSGAWQPFDTIDEAQSRVPLGARYKGLTQLILKDGVPTEYWYLVGTDNSQLIEKSNLNVNQVTQIAQNVVDANNILWVPTPSNVTFNNPNSPIISADGTQILNNYDRYTGVPFNATKVINWYDGTLMDDSKADGAVYFKVIIGGVASGYAMRNLDYEKSIDPSWWGMKAGLNADPNLNRTSFNAAGVLASLIKGKVIMPKGNFYTSGGSLQFQEGVLYDGAGQNASVWIKVDATTNPFLNSTAKTSFTIRNIGFNGGTQTQNSVSLQFNNCSNFTVEYCRFTNMKTPIWLNSSSSTTPCHDFKILFNQFDTSVDFGIRAKENSPYNGLIMGNTFEDVTKGIAVGEYSAIRVSGINISAVYNTIKSTVDTGIMFTQCVNCTADGNNINSTLVGIFSGTNSTGMRVVNNNITSERDFGIHAYNPSGTAFNAGGVYMGNKIYNTGKSGIYLEASSGNVVTGNSVLNPGRRIDIADREKCGIALISNILEVKSDNNNISGNVVVDDLTNQRMKYGIFEETSSASNIIGPNHVTGSTSEKVRSTTNTFSIGLPRLRQTMTDFRMSMSLGVGETTTATRPDAALYGPNSLLWDTDLKKHIYSDGTNWLSYALPSDVVASISGTSNQINTSVSSGVVTLSLPQDIAPASTPLFGKITVDLPAGQNKELLLSTAGSRRWIIRGTNTAETGSNAGSDFNLIAVGDDNAVLGTAIAIVRSTQTVTIPKLAATSPSLTGVPTSPTAAAGTNTTQIASTAFVQAAIAYNSDYNY